MDDERPFDDCSSVVIGACIEVHRHLGPGLLESTYERCLVRELSLRNLRVECERAIPITYKGLTLEGGYRLDIVVENELVVEVKAVERLLPVHEAQLLTYLKLTNLPVGLLVNFHAATIRQTLRRLTHQKTNPSRLPAFL